MQFLSILFIPDWTTVHVSVCERVCDRVPNVSPSVVVLLNNMRKVQNTATM